MRKTAASISASTLPPRLEPPMSLRLFGLAVGLVVTFTITPAARAAEGTAPPRDFVSLFNGQDLAGWHGMPHFDPRKLAAMTDDERARQVARWTEDAKQHWTAEGGELVNDGHGAYLTTDQEFGDVEFLIDYKTVARADSGIYLRGTPQVQIWDATPGGPSKANGSEKGSGGLFNNGSGAPGRDPLVLADRPFGEWNRLRIIQVGARTTVYLNDKLVVDHATMENFWDRSSPLFARGVIQLQTHGGEIRWRNIFLREIPADEANKILSAAGPKGFTPLFDGKSLDGWAGAVENYEVVDGLIRCKAGKGGVLYYDKEYSDFAARVQFKVAGRRSNLTAWRSATPGRGRPPPPGCASCKSSMTRPISTPNSTRASTTARSTGWSPPGAATSVRPASGTSRRSRSRDHGSRSS